MEHFTSEEKRQLSDEKGRRDKKLVEDSKLVDPVVRVRFQNIEDPPAAGKPSPPLSFVFGRYVFKESRSEEDGPDTALRHGKEYDLPLSVVNHLNSLKVPVYGHTPDPNTKALMSIITGYNNRFSCVPVNMGEFKPTDSEAQVQIRRGPGRQPKQAQAAQ